MTTPDDLRSIIIALLQQGYDVGFSIIDNRKFFLSTPDKQTQSCYVVQTYLDAERNLARAKLHDNVTECRFVDIVLFFSRNSGDIWLVPILMLPPSGIVALGKKYEPFKLSTASHERTIEDRSKSALSAARQLSAANSMEGERPC